MYLKELTLRGFKSFASATTLRFEPGITAVVGPNGSGKSNIVDALTWVMGEQGVKNLRGTAMQDVIFAGTTSRPPLGRAEVTLTIDNGDHTLDIDYTEVTISRTIFRGGGSQYAINGSECRLLDIQELLSDTGLGQQMHVIVGQGRLDEILHADPLGHRAFIEEAAGILKHRKRKERALRKLENTKTNLSRLDDLLAEIHKQLGPLGRQARISQRAQSIQVALRDAQARIYADDASSLRAKRADLAANLSRVHAELGAAQTELTRLRLRIEQLEEHAAYASPVIAKANQTWHDISQIEERLRSLDLVARERARSMEGQLASVGGDDPEMLEHRAGELEQQQHNQTNRVSDLRIDLDAAVEARAQGEGQLASLRQSLTELRRTTQVRDRQIADLQAQIAKQEATLQLDDGRVKDFTAQLETLVHELDAAENDLDSGGMETDESAEDNESALQVAQTRLHERLEHRNGLLERQHSLQGQIASQTARADALQDTLDAHRAPQTLPKDERDHVLGRLSEFLSIDPGWEDAVSRALDVFADAVVVSDRQVILRVLADADDAAKIVLIHPLTEAHGPTVPTAPTASTDPTDQLGAAGLPVTLDGQTTKPGVVHPGSLAEHIAAAPNHADQQTARAVSAAVRSLVLDVAAADTTEQAVEALNRATWSGAVTRAGVIVNHVGAVAGSAPRQTDISLSARRDSARQHAVTLERDLSENEQGLATANAQCDEARAAVDALKQQRTEIHVRREQTKKTLDAVQQRASNLRSRITQLEDRVKQTTDHALAHRRTLDDLNAALETAQQSAADRLDFHDLESRERQLDESVNHARNREVTAKVTWGQANATLQSLGRQIGLLREQAKAAMARRTRVQRLNQIRSQRSVQFASLADDACDLAGIVHRAVEQVSTQRERLQHETAGDNDELRAMRRQRDEMEPRVAQLQQSEHDLDVRRERLASEGGQLTEKVSERLGMGIDELIRSYGPGQPVPVLNDDGKPMRIEAKEIGSGDAAQEPDDDSAQEPNESEVKTVPYVRQEQIRRMERAQRDLAALGKVNPLATEEFDALQTRNRYLNEQRDDVVRGRDDLLQLIKDIDTTMVQVFESAFNDTAAAFARVFATLFPGGSGRLRLENPDDLLTTGVLVEASPAGKRVKQLSLLSGGERSLTALALLFAIFTARPSPFYVMDEVEAALDDVNLTRLLNAFNALREHAQLIVITHQQRTMGIADALYGVTMRADGVTAVVSEKLSRS